MNDQLFPPTPTTPTKKKELDPIRSRAGDGSTEVVLREAAQKDTGLLSSEAGLEATLRRYHALAREAVYIVEGKVLEVGYESVPAVVSKYIELSKELKAARTVITDQNNDAARREEKLAHLHRAYNQLQGNYDELSMAIQHLSAGID